MSEKKLILVRELCQHYALEISFFEQIETYGLLKVMVVSEEKFIHRKQLNKVEKIIRLHRDLEINMEGIDVILNLMKRIQSLEKELKDTRSHLDVLDEKLN